jgi:antitoxin CptB
MQDAASLTDARFKKLRFRAWRRGFVEADLILGPFADAHLTAMSAEDLDEFEALLETPDQDLYAWIMGMQPVPAVHDTPLMARLREFRFAARAARRGLGPA